MNRGSRGAGTTDASPDENAGWLGWVSGLAVAAFTAVGLAGAVLLTPGDPFACNLPNPSAWFLCGWVRRSVANLVSVTVVLVGVSLLSAFLVAILRASLRATRN